MEEANEKNIIIDDAAAMILVAVVLKHSLKRMKQTNRAGAKGGFPGHCKRCDW
ncbi:hypothetical protein JCM21738_2412 [Mesobacillus boroniphilus JCM 21738]|uniref:Uncharacterized protein n=1 Tax=Mesobacillus boroniphilus JCM 21738 TaxID=1294265 RepID=W4RMD8_9BACI|nr:hypothetical protein JCM21738_2412 [Mesobacillus boroniphilus JCM 21738]